MESLTFSGDAFSEYYLTHLLWDEARLQPFLGLDSVQASYRLAAAAITRGQQALRARTLPRSTRTLLLNPLAETLGWNLGDEETVETAEGSEDAGSPLIVASRNLARVRALAPDAPFDLSPTGIHRRFAPTLSMVRVLEEKQLTWGILVNAYELRLVRRAEGFVASHLGFDLTAMAEGTQAGFDAWKLLWALLRADALAVDPPVLGRVVLQGREHQEGVGKALGKQVQDALVAFLQGLFSHPDNQGRMPEPLTADYLQRLYAESLRILYRLLFALYSESRNLLPLDLPTYRDGYALTPLARRLTNQDTDPRLRPTTSRRYYEWSVRALFALLRQGANLGPEGRIPAYDGALFDAGRTALVEDLAWGDNTMAQVLEKLTLIPARDRGRLRLSYRELDVEQLGAIYESLLEKTPQVAGETMFRLDLDRRELIVNAMERARLARRRGEAQGAAAAPQDEEEPPEDETDLGDLEEGEAPEDEVPPASSRTPIRVVEEIPPGTLYLKAGAGRKQSGSFYTSRPLVEFLVRQTLDPLAQGKTPEEILALRVLDPAMGSGHFLVGACRHLGEHLLAAYRKRYEEVRVHQPDLSPDDVFLEAAVHPEVAANWYQEERTLTACRLLVAGNCLYGVDKNPLAVDLARVSLWLATAATDHPLTFLDHRLQVGDSLLGLPLYVGIGPEPETHLLQPETPARRASRRRRGEAPAPLLAGVPMREILTHSTRQLRERLARAMTHLQTISRLMNDAPGDFAGHRAAFDAMQGELRVFWELHQIRIGRHFLPAENASELEVVNRWLAEIAQHGRPSQEARGLAAPARDKGAALGAFSWELAFPQVFFGPDGQPRDDGGFDAVIGNPPWDKIKPNERECLAEFDPTVWDVQGQERRRFIEELCRANPRARTVWERHEVEAKTLAAVLLKGGIYHHQIAEVQGRQTGGDPDTFKFFTERAYQLLREGGCAGIIVPLGIQGSLGTTGLRRLLLNHCRLAYLVKLDNERYIFPGVFHGQKFDLMVFAKGGRTENFTAAFFSWEPAEVVLNLHNAPCCITLEADLYRELSPEECTFVELHGQEEVELLRRIYRQFPRLGEHREDGWNVRFSSELHMTGDSFRFRDAARLQEMGGTLHSRLPSPTLAAVGAPLEYNEGGEYWITPEDAWYADQPERFARIERWVDARGRVHLSGGIPEERLAYSLEGFVPADEAEVPGALPVRAGERYVPLYEGRMVHQFDHCQKAYVSGSGRRAKWEELAWNEKRIVPHFFVDSVARGRRIRIGIGLVTGQTNERTALLSIIPHQTPCGHSLATAEFDNDDFQNRLFLNGLLNSFVVDWILRLQVSNNIGFYHLYGLPIPKNEDFSNEAAESIIKHAGRLSCTTPDMAGLWEELARQWPQDFPLPWSREQACLDVRARARLRADIDARVARLYGLTVHEYARVLSAFPLLDRDQPPLPGDFFIRMTNRGERAEPRGFITRDLALLTFLELTGAEPPTDIVAFFGQAGVDVQRQTGPIRDLRERVMEATRRGAVAYIPSTRQGWSPDSFYMPPDLPLELTKNWDVAQNAWMDTDPQINGGALTFRGTDISVSLIYDLLQEGWTFPQVLTSYPQLTMAHVALALRWGQWES